MCLEVHDLAIHCLKIKNRNKKEEEDENQCKRVCELQTTMRIRAHADDVNAVCYAEDSPNILVTGSDDSLIKVHFCSWPT